jgi:hypothetical protein
MIQHFELQNIWTHGDGELIVVATSLAALNVPGIASEEGERGDRIRSGGQDLGPSRIGGGTHPVRKRA